MATAADAYYGRSRRVSQGTNYNVPLPRFPGGVRFLDFDPTAGSLRVILPDARKMPALGMDVLVIYNRHASTSCGVYLNDGTTLLQSLPAANVVVLGLLDQSTANGTWIPVNHSSATRSADLTVARQPWFLTIDASGTGGISLLDRLLSLGYDGTSAVALTVIVAEGVILGAPDTVTAALTTGELPAGSTLLLLNYGYVSGAGGAGGTGGNTPPGFGDPPLDGGGGGRALTLRCTTAISNHGTIAGGGGGGGGAEPTAGAGGGGGGGGAGSLGGLGGAAPFSGGGSPGMGGGVGVGGLGGPGGFSGGNGGGPGAVGSTGGGGGAAGGAAGQSIVSKTGAVITKIRTGTILGPETTEA